MLPRELWHDLRVTSRLAKFHYDAFVRIRVRQVPASCKWKVKERNIVGSSFSRCHINGTFQTRRQLAFVHGALTADVILAWYSIGSRPDLYESTQSAVWMHLEASQLVFANSMRLNGKPTLKYQANPSIPDR